MSKLQSLTGLLLDLDSTPTGAELQDRLTLTFSALADPTRRAILARLSSGEASVKELAKPFKISGPAITRHLKVLENAGLISRGREAQWRPCRIEPEGLKEVADWVSEYTKIWEERFDRLDAYLKTLKAAPSVASNLKTRNTRGKSRKSKGTKSGRKS